MLEHLLDFEPPIESADHVVPVSRVSAPDLVAAQQGTLDWLTAVGAPTEDSTDAQLAASLAQQAFTAVTTSTPTPDQHAALLQLKTPPAVRHLVGMLTAYDWEFIEQAKELRGYTVAKLVEETTNANPNIRLKALGLLGKVTEVGLFTDKIEVKKTDLTEDEIDKRLKEKLAKFMDVSDADVTDITEIHTTPPTTEDNSHTDA